MQHIQLVVVPHRYTTCAGGKAKHWHGGRSLASAARVHKEGVQARQRQPSLLLHGGLAADPHGAGRYICLHLRTSSPALLSACMLSRAKKHKSCCISLQTCMLINPPIAMTLFLVALIISSQPILNNHSISMQHGKLYIAIYRKRCVYLSLYSLATKRDHIYTNN